MIESVTYPYEIALSKANVKTNRIGSTKWTYDKEQFCQYLLYFSGKFCFSIRRVEDGYEELI